MSEQKQTNGTVYKILIPILVGLMMFFAGGFVTQLTAARGNDAEIATLKATDCALKDKDQTLEDLLKQLIQLQTASINQNTVLIAELKAAHR